MKAAESVPSPSKFCSALGTRSAAVSASAWGPTPKKNATVCSRTSPARRLSRMPAPTLAAPPVRGAAAWPSSLGSRIAANAPRGSAQPRHHQGDVVRLLDAALEIGELREHAVAHLAGGAARRRPGDGAPQAVFAVVLAVIVAHLGDAVGIDHEQVAGGDLDLVADVAGGGEGAGRRRAAAHRLHGAGRGPGVQQRRGAAAAPPGTGQAPAAGGPGGGAGRVGGDRRTGPGSRRPRPPSRPPGHGRPRHSPRCRRLPRRPPPCPPRPRRRRRPPGRSDPSSTPRPPRTRRKAPGARAGGAGTPSGAPGTRPPSPPPRPPPR